MIFSETQNLKSTNDNFSRSFLTNSINQTNINENRNDTLQFQTESIVHDEPQEIEKMERVEVDVFSDVKAFQAGTLMYQ